MSATEWFQEMPDDDQLSGPLVGPGIEDLSDLPRSLDRRSDYDEPGLEDDQLRSEEARS